jgi:hypothetical protein
MKKPCIWGNKKILRLRGKEFREELKATEEAVGSQEGGTKRKRIEEEVVAEREKSVERPAPKKRATRSQARAKSVDVSHEAGSSKGKEREKEVEVREEIMENAIGERESSGEVEIEILGMRSAKEVAESTREKVVSDAGATQEVPRHRGKSFF